MANGIALAVTTLLFVASACTQADDPAPEPESVRYAVDLGGAHGEGVVELGPGERACITLDTRLPKAAHLHRASRKGPADGILVTFFEPPTTATRRTCIEDADPRASGFVADDTQRVYVDLHYNPREEGVVGRLEPAP